MTNVHGDRGDEIKQKIVIIIAMPDASINFRDFRGKTDLGYREDYCYSCVKDTLFGIVDGIVDIVYSFPDVEFFIFGMGNGLILRGEKGDIHSRYDEIVEKLKPYNGTEISDSIGDIKKIMGDELENLEGEDEYLVWWYLISDESLHRRFEGVSGGRCWKLLGWRATEVIGGIANFK